MAFLEFNTIDGPHDAAGTAGADTQDALHAGRMSRFRPASIAGRRAGFLIPARPEAT